MNKNDDPNEIPDSPAVEETSLADTSPKRTVDNRRRQSQQVNKTFGGFLLAETVQNDDNLSHSPFLDTGGILFNCEFPVRRL